MTQNFFRLEEHRDFLAKSGKLEQFKKTYLSNRLTLLDNNNSKFWNQKNMYEHVSLANNPMANERVRLITEYLENHNIQKVLNIGFGSGDLENKIINSNKSFDWTGIDVSNDSTISAKKKFVKFKFYCADILVFKIPETYDAIVISEVMEHIQPQKIFQTLNKVHGALRKNGILIVSVPLNEDLENMVNAKSNPNAHLRVYTPAIIKTELMISKFIIDHTIKLFAFHNLFKIKSLIANLFGLWKPNNLIIFTRKA